MRRDASIAPHLGLRLRRVVVFGADWGNGPSERKEGSTRYGEGSSDEGRRETRIRQGGAQGGEIGQGVGGEVDDRAVPDRANRGDGKGFLRGLSRQPSERGLFLCRVWSAVVFLGRQI